MTKRDHKKLANQTHLRLQQERQTFLHRLEDALEVPMLILSFVWLLLMILELTVGLSEFLSTLNTVIWILFIIDFLIKLIIAPRKTAFLKSNLITLAALALPALRLFRIFRAARLLRLTSATRGIRLARVFTSLNRGISALGKTLSRRGFGYVVLLTILVCLSGAAGIYAFEKESIPDYSTAVWWTAMILTTMGSDYFPKTGEGRILCLFLAIYGFAVFGYVTATVATFFVGRDAANKGSEIASQSAIDELKAQIQALRAEIRQPHRTPEFPETPLGDGRKI